MFIYKGFLIDNLICINCLNIEDLFIILDEGIKKRKVGSHSLNNDSSRSHSVLIVYVITTDPLSGIQKWGKITFVDLAGSERVKNSNATGKIIRSDVKRSSTN